MRKICILAAALFLLAAPAVLPASIIKGGEKVTIDQPVEGNLYLAGGEVNVKAPIRGDLIAAGGKFWINEMVLDDGAVAGGEIRLDAEVMGDFRVVGGKIHIRKNIRGDLVVAGGEVTVDKGVVIGGDLMVFGGEISMEGTVNGKIIAGGGSLRIGGVAMGEVQVNGNKIVIDGEIRGTSRLAGGQVDLRPGAAFFADVRYWQEKGEMDFGDHLKNGASTTFDPALKADFNRFDPQKFRRGMFMFTVYRFLAAIVLIVLLITFFHNFFRRHAGRITNNLAGNFGYGMLYLIGLPVLIFLTFVTVIGIPVGFILAAGYGVSLALAGALVSVILAYELEKYLKKNWGKNMMMLIAVGISLALRLVDFIPLIGGVVLFLLVAVIFGYLYQNLRQERQLRRPPVDSDIV